MQHRSGTLWRPILLTLLLLSACGQQGPKGEVRRDTVTEFETVLTLQDTDGRESDEFERDEAITMIIAIRNMTNAEKTLTLTTTQSYDCVVSDPDGREIWRWSNGRMFAQILTEMKFAPREEKRFAEVWDQLRSDGSSPAPGRFEAVGTIPAGIPGTTSGSVPFSIR